MRVKVISQLESASLGRQRYHRPCGEPAAPPTRTQLTKGASRDQTLALVYD